MFGFKGTLAEVTTGSADLREASAKALSSSLLVCLVVPWAACLYFFSRLGPYYALDRRSVTKLTAGPAQTHP